LNLVEESAGFKGFTLLELIVVIVILGVLAVIALPKFSKIKETSIDKEAIANLKLIQAAEKIYKLEMTIFASASNTATLNDLLRLSLPAAGTPYWGYNATTPGSDFTARAQRTTAYGGDGTRIKWINQTLSEPSD
jgi:prepilin-type N-terminal cleavage/methylation domain-containing protein